MGRVFAEELAESGIDRRAALTAHLSSNHFPPVPLQWVPVCEMVIDGLNSGSLSVDAYLPNPVRAGEELPVFAIVGGLHLDLWIVGEDY